MASEVWNAAAVPWKLALIEAGIWMRCSTRFTAFTASPSALPGARLKLTTVDGNWPWWPMASCAVDCSQWATMLSGTCVPLPDFT